MGCPSNDDAVSKLDDAVSKLEEQLDNVAIFDEDGVPVPYRLITDNVAVEVRGCFQIKFGYSRRALAIVTRTMLSALSLINAILGHWLSPLVFNFGL